MPRLEPLTTATFSCNGDILFSDSGFASVRTIQRTRAEPEYTGAAVNTMRLSGLPSSRERGEPPEFLTWVVGAGLRARPRRDHVSSFGNGHRDGVGPVPYMHTKNGRPAAEITPNTKDPCLTRRAASATTIACAADNCFVKLFLELPRLRFRNRPAKQQLFQLHLPSKAR